MSMRLVLVSCFVLAAASVAHAQVALEPSTPAALPSDGFRVARPALLERHSWAAYASLDYARRPLEARLSRGARASRVIVSDHLLVHVGGAFAVHERVLLSADLPVHTLMRGAADELAPTLAPEGAGVGDLLLGARVSLLGTRESRFALAAEALAQLPTAELTNDGQRYSGDQRGRYEAAAIGELRRGRYAVRMRVGGRFRKPVSLHNLELGQELRFALAASASLPRAVSLHAELSGSTFLGRAFESTHTPLELLVGPKLDHGSFTFGVAVGPGLVRGYGAPDVRALGQIAYAPSRARPAQAMPATELPIDTDHDGIVNRQDWCPTRPEDMDQFQDADGCPDPDNDADGVLDGEDACPLEAGLEPGTQPGCNPAVEEPVSPNSP